MRLDAFDYNLPPELIAQVPLEDRAASRLMVIDRETGRWEHVFFGDLPRYLVAGDVLVLNRSRVIPARLTVKRSTGGKAELLAVRILDDKRFVGIGSPLKKLHPGDEVTGGGGAFACRIVERHGDRQVLVEVISGQTVMEVLDSYGHVPLPPYIDRPDDATDRTRYQTVFACEPGSVAAPTAGLHFDEDLLTLLKDQGVEIITLVLHVGLGTFLPLDNDEVEDNVLHTEHFAITGTTLQSLRDAREEGRRIIPVGTTSTRVLETIAREGLLDTFDPRASYEGETGLFLYPGADFHVAGGLITNFHLPRSSLLLLVSAFLGREKTLACYNEAVASKYRFYSYGDAMLIL